ncbi:MAG TPA: hypothetical protein VGP17_07050 [Solirubrobacteraceae bacterium]|nr:hypothetical protein [Solirubrobacteraceae bacterium]
MPCLIAAASLLRDHTLLLVLLLGVAVACVVVIAWDVLVNPAKPRGALRACYRKGRTLQKKLSQRKSFDAKEAENRAKEAVYEWAEKTWKVLKKHFPGHEQDFLGQGPMVGADDNSNIFNTYCEIEIDRCGGSADRFLAAKLERIGGLLRMDGSK